MAVANAKEKMAPKRDEWRKMIKVADPIKDGRKGFLWLFLLK